MNDYMKMAHEKARPVRRIILCAAKAGELDIELLEKMSKLQQKLKRMKK